MEKKYIYQQIKDYLLELIYQSDSASDIKLPSENQLAIKFGASRITAKNAITLLENENIIYRIHGKGTYAYAKKARELVLSKKYRFFLMLPNIDSKFISNITAGCSNYFSNLGQKLLLCVSGSQQNEAEILTQISSIADGIIVFPINGELHNKELLKLALGDYPIVFLDRTTPGYTINCVSTDHAASASKAVKALLAENRQRIGLITFPPVSASSVGERIKGFQNALGNYGDILYVQEGKKAIADIALFIQKNRLDGIITAGSGFGLDLYRALKQLNMKAPDDLSFIIYDDEYQDFEDFLPYKPTVLAQKSYMLGHEAAKMLHNFILSKEKKTENVLLESEIIFRDSTRSPK